MPTATQLCSPDAVKLQTTVHLHQAPLSGLEWRLIREAEPLKSNSVTFSKQGRFHADICSRQAAPPLHAGRPSGPSGAGLWPDKPAAGLRKHQRWLPKGVEPQADGPRGSRGVPGDPGLLRHGSLLICPPLPTPAPLMPTICVCNSWGPSAGARTSKQTPREAFHEPASG